MISGSLYLVKNPSTLKKYLPCYHEFDSLSSWNLIQLSRYDNLHLTVLYVQEYLT